MINQYVELRPNEAATMDHAMNVMLRMPYLELLAFAGAISGDADKIADAARSYADDKQLREQADDEA